MRSVRRTLPFAVLAAAFLWACATIVLHRTQEEPPGTITLRMGHWQLETSVRDAINELARDYQKLHPNVRVVQDAIPETTYGQWVTTQLMGGTAPDLMEVWLGLPWQLWMFYLHRYFEPLTAVVGKPNPYNAGTKLAGVPLRLTNKDGMRGSYVEGLQEYMTINLSQFGVRVFYNKGLLKRLTGLAKAPEDYRRFLACCEAIKAKTLPNGKAYTPIAGSSYHVGLWEWMMFDPVTFPAMRRADYNRDGYVSNDEQFVAFRAGRLDFDFPAYRARFKMFREITNHFQSGYTGLSRDEAVFLFAQQKAVFLSTGTWDARSLQQQTEGRFEVGVIDFPRPTKDDPEYGAVVEGPTYEQAIGGFPFGITRTCKHPEVALDFLLFLAAQRNNEKFNRIIGWIPAIKDTAMDSLLKAFEPHLNGVYSTMNFSLGGETQVKWGQLYSLYQVGQITYEELAAQYGPYYREHGLKDFLEVQRDWRRGIRDDEQFLSGIRARAMEAAGAEAETFWVKYRAQTATRQVLPEIAHARQMKLVQEGREPGASDPYEYGPDVLRRAKARL